jgi:hypothetical protein
LPELTGGLDSRFAPMLVQIRVAHNLATDELVLEIRVDDAGRLWRLCSLADGPSAHFIGSAGEIPNQLDYYLIVSGSMEYYIKSTEDLHLEMCIRPA